MRGPISAWASEIERVVAASVRFGATFSWERATAEFVSHAARWPIPPAIRIAEAISG